MKISQKIFQALMALVLVVSLLAPAALMVSSTPVRMSDSLAQTIAEDPGRMVRVIVQKAYDGRQAEKFVEDLGGEVLKELDLIHSFAAMMPARQVPRLSGLAAVNKVSLDTPIRSTSLIYETVRDEFNTVSYGGNDGSQTWAGDWQEINESDGPRKGDELITSDLDNNRLQVRNNDGGGEGVQRQADLSGATSATLTFDYRRKGLDNSDDYLTIEISADGGATWTELDRFVGPDNDSSYQPWGEDISTFISPNTTIRFISSSNLGKWDRVYFDNVQIEYPVGEGATTPPETPPVKIDLGEYDPVEMKFVADDFEGVPYTFGNNSGTRNWTSVWHEGGEHDGPEAGALQIVPDNRGGHSLQMAGNGLSLTRSADLSNSPYAKFYFEVEYLNLEPGDYVAVEISSDGGLSWAKLGRLPNSSASALSLNTTGFSITDDYSSGNTTIRFRTVFEDGDQDDTFILDNVRILFDSTTDEVPRNHYLNTLDVPETWALGLSGQGVTVAVVDSGITDDPDFGGQSAATMTLKENPSRLLTQQVFTENTETRQDNFGHGTHVAGIIAGEGAKSGGTYMGVAPQANLISLKVCDDYGMAYESDTVYALQWIFDHKDEYNIRVVNLSIQSTVEQSYHDSALDAAAEILWFNGVVVVAAAGNKTEDTDYEPIMAAPANDPFIISVGATNEQGDSNRSNDWVADFTSRIETVDAILKPEIFAPGTDIISTLASSSWWQNDHPERFVDGGYFRISGTSMATPMVSGAIALLLESEPDLTPDQVKYRLLETSKTVKQFGKYLNVYDAVTTATMESANQDVIPHMLLAKMAMMAYWASQNGEEEVDWENIDWTAVNWTAVNWNAVNWNAVNWNAVNWNAVNWNAVNWNAVNWNAVNWNAVNWNAVNWNAVNWNAVNWNAVNWNAVNWTD